MTEPVAALTDFSLSLVRNGIRNQVLERIDLQIRPGEILGLVGESGSGKSVLALSLLGLLPHTSHPQADGQVTVSGVDMVRASPAELRRVRGEVLGAIFQDPMTSLNPTVSSSRTDSASSWVTSPICLPIRIVGFSDVIGSWKIAPSTSRRTRRSSAGFARSMSTPPTVTSPSASG